jgi:DNA-binding transcriptional LysR family regulator/DNA-binding CsgD family transcriptional regulator
MATLAPSCTLRAGCAPALPAHRLFAFVRALRAREPDVAIDVTHLISVDQLKLLRDGDLDLAIVFDPDEDPDLEIELLFPGEELAACLPAGHRLAERRVIRPPDLFDETLVCSGRSVNPAAYERALDRFAAAGYRFRRVEETGAANGRELVLSVASGRGIAMAPPSLEELSEAHNDVILRPLDPPVRMPPSAVVWRSDAAPELGPILETVRTIARELSQSAELEGSRGLTSLLTPRQFDVVSLLAEGKTTREIADELNLSETTVRNHIAGLMAALGVHTRLQAVIAAKRAGLLEL